jgi:solute carrier family 25 S-adenosylmethionine transporter 26
VAGGALTFTKTLVKYPLDTVTVRLQMPGEKNKKDIWKDPFNGIVTPLFFNIPGGAVFFAVKDACKSYLRSSNSHWEVSKFAATCIAVGIANFPYWVVRNPSEVLKTKQQAASVLGSASAAVVEEENGNAWQVFRREQQENGWTGFYVGYWENIVYAYPADVFKFVLYDQFVSMLLLSGGATMTTPLEGALAGALATAVAQLLTTPLDVVRNRVMTGTSSSNDDGTTSNANYFEMLQITAAEGALWAGAAPRVGKALLSGAIQFATYEETKRQLADFFFSASSSVTVASSLGVH